jgi:IKI3 family
MKDSINLGNNKGRLKAAVWDPVDPYRLHMMFEYGHYSTYSWMWTINHSSGLTSDDDATVAVIDGGMLYSIFILFWLFLLLSLCR